MIPFVDGIPVRLAVVHVQESYEPLPGGAHYYFPFFLPFLTFTVFLTVTGPFGGIIGGGIAPGMGIFIGISLLRLEKLFASRLGDKAAAGFVFRLRHIPA
jgi:hypothetical protein